MIQQSNSWAYIQRKTKFENTCTPVFIAALFTTVRTWKQSKCPLTNEWIRKMWCVYSMEYYSAIKKKEIGSFVVMWLDLESVIQIEVSQNEKKIIY